MLLRRRLVLATVSLAAAAALSGCAGIPGLGGGETTIPVITGTPTSYASLEDLRDAFVAAGGECAAWEEIDPGEADARGGRCGDDTVLAVYADPAELAAAVEKSVNLATSTHLLVGENWMLNTPEPHRFVDALGGTVVVD